MLRSRVIGSSRARAASETESPRPVADGASVASPRNTRAGVRPRPSSVCGARAGLSRAAGFQSTSSDFARDRLQRAFGRVCLSGTPTPQHVLAGSATRTGILVVNGGQVTASMGFLTPQLNRLSRKSSVAHALREGEQRVIERESVLTMAGAQGGVSWNWKPQSRPPPVPSRGGM